MNRSSHFMKAALVASLVWLSSIPLLPAQQAAAEEAPRPVRGRVAHMVYTSMPEGFENPVKVMAGTEVVSLELSKRMASEAVKIPADGILRIIRPVDGPVDATKPAFATLAQALVPEGVDKALIILIPTPKKAGSDLVFRTEIHDLAAFTGGDFLYLNLTSLNVLVEMGKDKLTLEPGKTKIFDAPNLAEPTNMPTRYSFFHPVQKKWRMLSASTVVLQSTRREICIFSWDTSLERVDYHGITFPVAP